MKKFIKPLILSLSLSAWLMACQSIETTQPRQSDIVDAVFASGHIIADQEYLVTANAEGYLAKRFVEEGFYVEAGAPLFQLSGDIQSEQLSNARDNYEDAVSKLRPDAPERLQLELQISQAKAQRDLDKKNYERYQRLFEAKAVSASDYERVQLQYENAERNVAIQEKALIDLINTLKLNAKNTESQLVIQKENNADYYLSSAIHGEVLQVFKEPGELVRRGEAVAKIGGGEKRIKLFVSEEDIQEIQVNQAVVVNLNTDRSRIHEAKVVKIFPSFDDVEQSFIVEAAFLQDPPRLYHNTQLQANIIIGQKTDAWVIPSRFLTPGDSVKVKGGNLQYVEVGLRNDQWVEILGGIDAEAVLQKRSL